MDGRNAKIAIGAIVLLGVAIAVGVVAYLKYGPQPVLPPHRPASAYAQIPKIDVHVHVPPERASEAAIVFARHGIELALNASGGHPGESLDETLAASERVGGRIPPYCNIAFDNVEYDDFDEYATQTLRRCREDGAIGLKIFKSLGLGIRLSTGELLRVDDPRLDIVFEQAGELGLPVLIHTGDPQAFFTPADENNERLAELEAHPSWSFYGPQPGSSEPWPSWEEVFAQYEARVARHPETQFLGAHFGNAPEEPQRIATMLEMYANLFVETGARIPEIGRHDPQMMRELFIRFHDRILFGTDIQMSRTAWILGSMGERPDPPERIPFFYESHWRYFETDDRSFAHPTPIQGDWTIDGLNLPREVLEDIYHRNAERLFGLEPLE